MLSAHRRHDEDKFLQQAVNKVIEDNINKKLISTQIKRWSYEVGFKIFMENPAFQEIFNYFKSKIADVLANEGWQYKNCLIFI